MGIATKYLTTISCQFTLKKRIGKSEYINSGYCMAKSLQTESTVAAPFLTKSIPFERSTLNYVNLGLSILCVTRNTKNESDSS